MQKRVIDVILPVIFHESVICVYRVWFGDSFYIGSTVNLNVRINLLCRVVLGCFEGKRIGRNSPTEIMNHLIRNPDINQAIVEVIEFVSSEYELVEAERSWIDKYFLDINCLNYSNKTSRKINGVMIRPASQSVCRKNIG